MAEATLYKAILFFLNGRSAKVVIPGVTDTQGSIHLPESISIDKIFFALKQKAENAEPFEYYEIKDVLPISTYH